MTKITNIKKSTKTNMNKTNAKVTNLIKTFLVTSLAVIIAFTAIPPTEASAVSVSDFKDVTSDYWGYSYIDFSAKNGIINGYLSYDGSYTFLPENSVTKEESMSMLYRLLSAAGKLKSEEDFTASYETVLNENKIADWAKKYVAYGLKYGIIKQSELADFTDENGAGQPAPRQQVAVFAAMSMEKPLAPAYSLAYVDKDNISSENLPYVDMLYRQNIMRGDDTKLFNPLNGIKRSEFSAICQRIYNGVKSDTYLNEAEVNSFSGQVVSVDTYNNRIMLNQTNGAAKIISVNPKAQLVIDGKINFNGLSAIPKDSQVIIGYGAFYYPGRDGNEGVLQLHIDTKLQAEKGLISDIKTLDANNSIYSIENEDGDVILYLKDKNSKLSGSPQKGKEVTFLSDGVKILELK